MYFEINYGGYSKMEKKKLDIADVRMINRFLNYFVSYHTYKPNGMGKQLQEHQKTLSNLTVAEAIKSIHNYTQDNTEICCLYAAVAFLNRFSKDFADIHLAFSPEENPLYPKPNRRSSKVVIVLQGKVYDIVSMIEYKDKKPFDFLIKKYTKIPIQDYCKKHLKPGEEFTVLPDILGSENVNFVDFFFSNPVKQTYSIT